MGFPENSETSYSRDKENINNFHSVFNSIKSFVDGVEVEITPYSFNAVDAKKNKYRAYWIKKVKFEKNQKRKIVVDYTVYNTSEIEYNFTGGNWFKNVEHSKLIIYPMGGFNPGLPYPDGVKSENGNYVFEKYNWEAEYTFKWQAYVKSFFESTLTKYGIYDVFKGEIFGYTYLSFYFYKDYLGKVKYISPVNLIFPPHKFQQEGYSLKHFVEFYDGNIISIDRKGVDSEGYYTILDYIDLNKSVQPWLTCRYIKSKDRNNLLFIEQKLKEFRFYYIKHIKKPSSIKYTSNKYQDTTKIVTKYDNFYQPDFSLLDSNAYNLEYQINNNYGFLVKVFYPDKYKNNLETYVLQMIFIGNEEGAWKYFDEHFPVFCSKQNSKDYILEMKQKIFEFKD